MQALKSDRLHIGVFGKTNVGKSSVLNRITGQEISIVSDMLFLLNFRLLLIHRTLLYFIDIIFLIFFFKFRT